MNETPTDNSHQLPPEQNIPTFQLQIPTLAMPQQPVSNTQTLLESLKDFVIQGNKSEEKVALQIILICSAILAIISSVGLSKDIDDLDVAVGLLLITAVTGLGVSLIAGVIHFISERKFWYTNWGKASDALKVMQTMSNPAERENAALVALSNTEPRSSRVAFWIQIISFLVGVTSLLVLIVAAIISKIN
jgi:hypothetical protein